MKSLDYLYTAFVVILAVTLMSGCAAPIQMLATQPSDPTATPFQPIPHTATPTLQPTETPSPATSTFTNTPAPTKTSEAESQTDEPVEPQPTAFPTTVSGVGMITVPILLYHHISETIDTQYNVHPEHFAEQMKWLHDRGYMTITIADVARVIRDGGDLPTRPVILTFDDGYLDVYLNAYPILQQYGYVATFYIIGETVETTGNLNTKKLLKLLASGWEIGSHSMTHADLTKDSDWEYEIYYSKIMLEDKLGTEIRTFAFPYGRANDDIRKFTIDAGYSAAVGLGSIMDHDTNNLYFLHRKEIKSWYGLDFFEEFMPWTD